jgi:uncharacterized protein (DUF952 family)
VTARNGALVAEQSLYHIAQSSDWIAAQGLGEYSAPSLGNEGFLHFSTVAQLIETAALYFPSEPSLLLLKISAQRLGSNLLWEPSRNNEDFPHYYGKLALEAVEVAYLWHRGGDGRFTVPALENLRVFSVDK